MPYPGVPSNKTGKMESCVKRVTGTGKSKDSAIAICHDAVMGGKKEIEKIDDLSDDEVEKMVEDVLEEGYEERVKTSQKQANKTKGAVPYGITTMADLDNYRKASENAYQVYSLTSDFTGLVDSIMGSPDVQDKTAAIRALTDEFSDRISQPISKETVDDTQEPSTGFLQRVVKSIADMFGLSPKEQETAMMIWKEEDGSYKWLARYSNNFRDNDNPPEIISEQSHRRFVDMVDKGEYAAPELWLWHRPEWKCGVATDVAYDDTGFAVATGYFDKGKEFVAEWLSKQKNVAVSHAMPPSSIVRSTEDSSVILQHQTVEISPLPLWAAANKLTGFVVIQDAYKEADMAIPTKKRETFVKEWGFSPDLLDKLEQQNAQDAQKAANEGRESKEKTEQTAETEENSTTTTTADAAQEQADQSEQTTDSTPDSDKTAGQEEDALNQSPSRREIADAFGGIFAEMKETLEKLSTRVEEIGSEVKEVKTSEEDRISKAASSIPPASLGALLAHRIVGSRDAVVDGRTSLARSKPKETDDAPGTTGIPFIDRMINDNEQN
jgi:hypothetical protein